MRIRIRVAASSAAVLVMVLAALAVQPSIAAHKSKKTPPAARGKAEQHGGPAQPAKDEVMVRVRVAELAPATYARIRWHWGGGALGVGKEPVVGELTAIPPQSPPQATGPGGEPDFILEKSKNGDCVWVKKGVWLKSLPLGYFQLRGFPFVNFVVLGKPIQKGRGAGKSVDRCALEFELSYQGKVVKTFTETAPEGAWSPPTFRFANWPPTSHPRRNSLIKSAGCCNLLNAATSFLKPCRGPSGPCPSAMPS